MKKLLFAALALAVGFTSCKDDEAKDETGLVGTWRCVYIEQTKMKDGENIGGRTGDIHHNDDIIFQFNADGTYTYDREELGFEDEEVHANGKWTLSGNTLSLRELSYGDKTELTIEKIDAESMETLDKYTETYEDTVIEVTERREWIKL
jgi:uncharacterized protein (TIGR03066 family)